ncbi:unannotated protein [freshwater metagenome]|uniref:Unannotated protein n=1 Tax=freshwater metagenome TaxID=449393 RepID=A0A6J7D1D6_9ZZZZ
MGAVGMVAGAVNAVVGSGTLLTYPLLLSIGLPPVIANGTNNVGLSIGGSASAWAYRRELAPRLRVLALPMLLTVCGAVIGSSLVVRLPQRVFTTVVPWLILAAVVLVALQPVISRRLARRAHHLREVARDLPVWTGILGIYGGYFGAGQGVMYMGVLGLRYDEDLQQANGAKNLLAASGNLVSAVVFIAAGAWSWTFAAAIAVGSLIGGYAGGRFARVIPPQILRILVVGVGLYAAAYLFIVY